MNRVLIVLWRSLTRDLFDAYRPELHYMRGPGPRWREKHTSPASAVVVPLGLTESPA